MAEENKDQKTEEATPKRITDTEEKGNFIHSREVSSSFVLLAAILSFAVAGQRATLNMMGTWKTIINDFTTINLDPSELYRILKWVIVDYIFILSPILV